MGWTWVIAPAIAVLSAIFAAIWLLYDRMNDRLRALELDMAVSKTQLTPLWATVQKVIVDELHHVGHPEMDRLLEKLQNLSITPEERIELKAMLEARALDYGPEITESERKSAILLIGIMDKVLIEAATAGDKLVNLAILLLFWTSNLMGNAIRYWR